jgi:hypothetical protein
MDAHAGWRGLDAGVSGQPADPTERLRREEAKHLRQSRRALWPNTVLGATSVALLYGLNRFVGLPAWVCWLLGFFAVFGAVGDAINIVYLRRRLARTAGNLPGAK